jgi:hypothetical protein
MTRHTRPPQRRVSSGIFCTPVPLEVAAAAWSPALSADIRSLVRRISRENPLWGAPRIDDGLLKLGIQIAQSTVAKASVIWRAIQSAVGLAVTLI